VQSVNQPVLQSLDGSYVYVSELYRDTVYEDMLNLTVLEFTFPFLSNLSGDLV